VLSGTQAPSFGGGRFLVDRAVTTDLATDSGLRFSRTSMVDLPDMNLGVVQYDYLV
jgi:hypothetical protein